MLTSPRIFRGYYKGDKLFDAGWVLGSLVEDRGVSSIVQKDGMCFNVEYESVEANRVKSASRLH